jgi:hypothetical protein
VTPLLLSNCTAPGASGPKPPAAKRRLARGTFILTRGCPRGSVLIVALIFATAIAMTLTAYLQLAQTTLRVANRAHYANIAMNLAETGLERGMLAIATSVENPAFAWPGWRFSADGKDAYRTFDGFTYEGNTTGVVRVRVQDYQSAGTPVVIARATVNLGSGAPIEKWLRVRCGKTSPFRNSMTGENVVLMGGSKFDSYSSTLGEYGATLADGSTNTNDNAFVGATVLERGSAAGGEVVIQGSVSVASEDGLRLGSAASVGPAESSGINEHYVRYDFTRDYEDTRIPSVTGTMLTSIKESATLPRNGDPFITVAGRKTYYYTVTEGIFLTEDGARLTIGELPPGPPPGVDVVIVVRSPIHVTGAGAGIQITGNNGLALYAAADVTIGGAGVANDGKPAQFQLWGTRPQSEEAPQTFDLVGNDGEFRGVIYGPNASITIAGDSSGSGGDVFGAIVGRDIKLSGSDFHYDEALRDLYKQYAYRVTDWEELASAKERSDAASALSF